MTPTVLPNSLVTLNYRIAIEGGPSVIDTFAGTRRPPTWCGRDPAQPRGLPHRHGGGRSRVSCLSPHRPSALTSRSWSSACAAPT